MTFEDFNYNQFNKYILLDENQEYYEEEEAEDTTSGPTQKLARRKIAQVAVADDEEEQKAGKLNDQILHESIKESYQHSQFDTVTELERQQAIENEQQAKLAKEIEENEERLKAEKEEAEEGEEEEQGEGKEDGDEDGEDGDEGGAPRGAGDGKNASAKKGGTREEKKKNRKKKRGASRYEADVESGLDDPRQTSSGASSSSGSSSILFLVLTAPFRLVVRFAACVSGAPSEGSRRDGMDFVRSSHRRDRVVAWLCEFRRLDHRDRSLCAKVAEARGPDPIVARDAADALVARADRLGWRRDATRATPIVAGGACVAAWIAANVARWRARRDERRRG